MPAEYARYKKLLSGDNRIGDARASIALLPKARRLLETTPAKSGLQMDARAAYSAAWRLCLRLMKESKDPEAQQLIIDQWNKSLKDDGESVALQVYSLSDQWDRRLLTDDFWRSLGDTKCKMTMSSIAYVLYLHGNRDDLDRLKRRRASLQEGNELCGIVQNAINYMNYRLAGDFTHPGPAALGPTMIDPVLVWAYQGAPNGKSDHH